MCGICGVVAIQNGETETRRRPPFLVANYASMSLHTLQHRGQEAVGIAVDNQGAVSVHKGEGLVSNVFKEVLITSLAGNMAIGHVRYGTTGGSTLANAQPQYKKGKHYEVAVVHNGNLVNSTEIRSELEAEGVRFESTSDTEAIAALIADSEMSTLEEAVADVCVRKLKGAYSILILSPGKIVAVRDPYGIRPISLGRLKNEDGEFYLLSSETCAFDFLQAQTIREIAPGEILSISPKGMLSRRMYSQGKPIKVEPRLCIFEFVYFSRPDSFMMGRTVYDVREKMGQLLAIEFPDDKPDMVIGVPDSGTPAAIGFSLESGVPYGIGLIKNRYVGRTFIAPEMRSHGVRLKLNPLRTTIEGKRIVVVDDSIVRGTTTNKLVKMLRDAGAREVHLRIASPPVIAPCFYGIDTAERRQLIAARYSIDEVEKQIGADSLGYLSLEGMIVATGCPKSKFCLACFNKDYPIKVCAREKGKFRLG